MTRSLLVALGLFFATPALACGGGDCDGSHCKMKSTDEVAGAMAEVDSAKGDKLTLTVEGMRCGTCSDKVTAALKAIDGVHAVATSATDGQARVAYDAKKVEVAKLVSTIEALGYKAKAPEST